MHSLSSFYKTDYGLYIDVWNVEAIRFHEGKHRYGGPADIFLVGRTEPIVYNLTVEDMDTIAYLRK